jgi:hypothetical protein
MNAEPMKLLPPILLALAAALPALALPPPPADLPHRFGVYAWGFDTAAYPSGPISPDRLNWAADKVARAGSRTIRVYLGARDDYKVNPPNIPEDELYLARLVAGPGYTGGAGASAGTAYDLLFQDPRFDTYLLTVFTPADATGTWQDGYNPFEALFARTQIARLGDLLLERYPDKTFLLLNWEGDNALAGHLDEPAAWDGFAAWIAARAAGVRDARARHPTPPGRERLFSGLEFNRLRRHGVWCGTSGTLADRCVLDFVAPGAEVDYYSYSSWETLAARQQAPAVPIEDLLRADLGHILTVLRKGRPDLPASRLLLGEAGFARTAPAYGECAAAADLRALLETLAANPDDPVLGVAYAVVWQALDNAQAPGSGASPESFGLYRGSDGGLTLPGATFRALLAGAFPDLPSRCPRLADCPGDPGNSCAVSGPAAPWEPVARLVAGQALSIAGEGFSASGNTVHLVQGIHRFALPAPGRHGWQESPERIDLTLPRELLPGLVLLYVTDARGLDSNGEILTLAPPPDRGNRDHPPLRN